MAARLFNGASAACLLAAASLTASTAAAFALARPATDFSRTLGLAGSSEAVADTLIQAPATDEAGRTAAAAASRHTLSQAPASATAWLRLAYIDSLSPDGPGAIANRAIAASYVAAPFGPDDTPFRLQFALNHWQSLEIGNRELVLDEIRYVAQVRPELIRRTRAAVTNPVGMLALSLTAPPPPA